MKDTELLLYISKTAEMGVIGLRDVEDRTKGEGLRTAITQQIHEYEAISKESAALLERVGEKPNDPGLLNRISSEVMTMMKTMNDSSDSTIAEMVIQGNTMGISKIIQHIHDYDGNDADVRRLADKLLETEQANVEQMKQFL
ncbi:MAG: hypothetical protein PHO41_00435 [Eubacteriales bacterium]|nr:hypothetical protein [Eubacteriales bacterium]